MELHSSNPNLEIHSKELEEFNSRALEEIDEQCHDKYNPGPGSYLLFPGWMKTSKRWSRCKARKDSSLDQEISVCGVENLPLKKRKLELHFLKAGNSMIRGAGCSSPSESSVIFDNLENPGAESAVSSVISDDNGTRTPKGHVCNICNRSFMSYQALGGHKAHHNNNNNQAIKISLACGKLENEFTERPQKRSPVHQCTFCDKIFSKGQALGGHRRHCKRPCLRQAWDLNELPPEWISEE